MESNLSLRLRDEREIEFLREKVGVVGGCVLYPRTEEKPASLKVYGFSELNGPWGCGKFQGDDCTVYFPHADMVRTQTGYYADDKKMAITLDLRLIYWSKKSVALFLDDKAREVRFQPGDCRNIVNVVGNTEGIYESLYSCLWTKTAEGIVPFSDTENHEKVPDLIQICGFRSFNPLVTRNDAENIATRYRAEVTLRYDSADPSLSIKLNFNADSVKEILQSLYAASQGITEMMRAIGLSAENKRQVRRLVRQLERQAERHPHL